MRAFIYCILPYVFLMKAALVLMIFVSFSLILSTAYAETRAFISDPSKDGWASENTADKTGNFINIGNVMLASGEYQVRRGFLYFDTSSIPSNAIISDATLKVYGANYANSCRNAGNIKIYPCNFSPLSKDDYNACVNNAANSAVLDLREGMRIRSASVKIDSSIIAAGGYTQIMLKSRNEQCEEKNTGTYARICADGMSETGCTEMKKPVLEVTYTVPVEIISADVSNACPVETETVDVLCRSSVTNVNCIGARIGDAECVWDEASGSTWENDVALFKNCAVGAATNSVCGAGSREVLCYVKDACKQTGTNKTAAIDVQAESLPCNERADQSECEADDICSWAPFCSGTKNSSQQSECIPKESDPDYQCKANSCGAECDGSVGCPPKLVGDLCKYSGVCDQENTCTCSYTDQYCPQAGTTRIETDGTTTCYYGVQACESVGCSLSTCTLEAGETCSAAGGCVIDTCSDEVKNNDETDIDCGGSCDACADGKACLTSNDCSSENCVNGTCEVGNDPPVLTSISASPYVVNNSQTVNVSSVASDPDGNRISLECGSSAGAHDLCFDVGAVQQNPSCSFASPWTDSAVHTIYCRVFDNHTMYSDEKTANITSTNATCVPKTCADLRRVCGNAGDACGTALNCGTCPTDKVCTSSGQCAQRTSSATTDLKKGESAQIQSSKYSGMTITVNEITIPSQQETYETCIVQNVDVTIEAESPALSENYKLSRYPVAPNYIRKGTTLIKFLYPGYDAASNKIAYFQISDNCTNVPGFVCGSDNKGYLNACDAESAGIQYAEGPCQGKCYAISNPCALTNSPTCTIKPSLTEVTCGSSQCKIGACTVCGNKDQACCTGDTCNVDASLNCVPFGTLGEERCMQLSACGSDGEVCCSAPGFACESDLVCYIGKCRRGIDLINCKDPNTNCGAENQLCCPPDNVCNSGLVCDIGRCKVSSSGTCGDGTCNVGENTVTCALDCQPLSQQNTAGSATGGDFLSRLIELIFK